MKQNFTHTCSACQFLGSTKDPQNSNATCDLYICRPTHRKNLIESQASQVTVIARYSNEESDYQSGLNVAFEHGGSFVLWVASQRAIRLGYLTMNEWDKATRFGRGL